MKPKWLFVDLALDEGYWRRARERLDEDEHHVECGLGRGCRCVH